MKGGEYVNHRDDDDEWFEDMDGSVQLAKLTGAGGELKGGKKPKEKLDFYYIESLEMRHSSSDYTLR